jgi:flagellar assembly protein FliH
VPWCSRVARKTPLSESTVAGSTVASYAFRQLDAPPAGTSDGIADVLSAVRAEAEQIRAQAWAAGEAEGRAAGLAVAHTDAQPALAALSASAEAISELRTQVVAELEQDAVEMALRLAEQILAGVLSVQPERVLDVARNALRHLTERRRVTLVVNPADLELVSECVEQLQSELGGIEHLAVQADRRVARGGAVARTDTGDIDAGIDTQLSRARELVADALAGPLSDDGTDALDGARTDED